MTFDQEYDAYADLEIAACKVRRYSQYAMYLYNALGDENHYFWRGVEDKYVIEQFERTIDQMVEDQYAYEVALGDLTTALTEMSKVFGH